MDNEIRELERRARQNEAGALETLQVLRDTMGLGSSDAEYFKKYTQLSEDFITSVISITTATRRLKELNEEYKFLVGSKTLRPEIMGANLMFGGFTYVADMIDSARYGWESSQVC